MAAFRKRNLLKEVRVKTFLYISVQALALCAGAAWAGNDSTVDQIGERVEATVEQTLNGGASNVSYVYQGKNSDTGSSFAQVAQVGGAQSIVSSTVTQDGYLQFADIKQDATNGGQQVSQVTQTWARNGAEITQTTPSSAIKQESYVTQDGWNGYVVVLQSGAQNYSDIAQSGDTGYVRVSQDGASTTSNVTQDGLFNSVKVYQGGVSDRSEVTQSGVANNGDVSRDFSLETVYGGVTVYQQGASTNDSHINQSGALSGAAVVQNGSAGYTNEAHIDQQSGASNFAVAWQVANAGGNYASITQGGAGANFALAYQH
jgi:hypothetical protein